MLLAALVAVTFRPPVNFYADGPYDPSVPRPESILGYGPGERHTTFRDQERVDLAIAAAAKNRVKVIEYGKSTEGRPLRIYVISSPENFARLAEIQKEHQDLAAGKGDPSKVVPITWINQCIHGDETASFESGMWSLYNLVASKGSLAKALQKSVVILNPVYNPDGHERYVVYYNSIAVGTGDSNSYEHNGPSVMYGRLNHYRFDLNRDRVSFSQAETRQEFAEMLKWNPQVYIDQHGQVGSYFFPPEPMSINPNVDRTRNAKWTDVFGRATGKAFDSHGLSYFVGDTFDLYYPGYLDSSNTLSGAIGMTHETDGGRYLLRSKPDGSSVTLKQGVEKHFVSAMAVVRTAAEHGSELMKDYAQFKRNAISGSSAGTFQTVVVANADERPLKRLQAQLARAGITSELRTGSVKLTQAHGYWASDTNQRSDVSLSGATLTISIRQSQGALAKSLLEPGNGFEPEFIKAQSEKKKTAPDGENYPGPDSPEFYDYTGWALPYAHGLTAYWVENPKDVSFSPISSKASAIGTSPVGYALRYADREDILAVYAALTQGVRGSLSTKPMKLDGKSYPAGTFLFPAGVNEDGYEKTLLSLAKEHHLKLEPLTTAYPDQDRFSPGSENLISLRKPSIAVVMGSAGSLGEVGALWYLMEQEFHLPFAAISQSALTNGDLSQYTCIIVPGGVSATAGGKLKDWVSQGNVVVGLNGDWAVGSSGFVELEKVKGDPQDLPGSLFRMQVDSRSFLAAGYEANPSGKVEIAVPVQGGRFYAHRKEGGSIVTTSDDAKVTKLLSGWAWPDETEKLLTGTTWVQDAPVGRGHAVLFFTDPTERAMWPGFEKMLLNAMIVGSGA